MLTAVMIGSSTCSNSPPSPARRALAVNTNSITDVQISQMSWHEAIPWRPTSLSGLRIWVNLVRRVVRRCSVKFALCELGSFSTLGAATHHRLTGFLSRPVLRKGPP